VTAKLKNKVSAVARGQRLNYLWNQLLALKRSATEHYFKLGEIMKEIRDKELWRESFESFASLCADDELGFSYSHVKNAITLVERFPKWRSLIDIPYSKLIMIGPHLKEDNKRELVAMARSLSRSDLRHQLVVKGVAEKEPRARYLPKIYPCSVCGKVRGVSFEGLCHCGMSIKQVEYISLLIEKVKSGDYEL